jgi:hypothetical protein
MGPRFRGDDTDGPLPLMLRSIAARRERRCFHSPSALRCVSKHEGEQSHVLILRDARTRLRIRGTSCACALLRMRTRITAHRLKQHTLPRRGALLRERAFAAARAGWSDPCIFLFFCRFGSSIPGLTISNNTHSLVPAARSCARGFASLLHSPRIEGWAERRETFGCVRSTRWTRHNAACQAPSEAPCVP